MPELPEYLKRLSSIETAHPQHLSEQPWEYPRAGSGGKKRLRDRVRKRGSFLIEPRGRHWAVIDTTGHLVCLTVYKCGAEEVIRRIANQR